MLKIILASSSPRRKMLLEQLGLEFEIVVSDVEEKVEAGLTPEEVAKSLAYQKAMSVADPLKGNYLVLGLDTIVVIENEILGKPGNESEIYEMLRKLSGKTHQVLTGICVVNILEGSHLIECDISNIKFREISDEEIKAYIKSGEPFDKAGSYAIQGLGGVFVEKITGSYSGIVGLPVFLADRMLKHYGVKVLNSSPNPFS